MQFVALCVHEGASGVESEGEISGVDDKRIPGGFVSSEMMWMNHD